MSSRCHTIRSDLGWGLADINADGTVKTLQDLLVLSGTGNCLLEKSEVRYDTRLGVDRVKPWN